MFRIDTTIESVMEGTVKADGSLVLTVYLTRVEKQILLTSGVDTIGGTQTVPTYYGAIIRNVLPVLCKFSNPGYYFNEWLIDVDGEGVPASELGEDAIVGEENVTGKASWLPNEYQVVYAGNGGSLASSVSSSDTIENVNYEDSIYIKDYTLYTYPGYTQIGWTYGSGESETPLTSGKQVSIASLAQALNLTAGSEEVQTITLNAKWQANSYTITYHINTASGSQTVSSNSFVYDPANENKITLAAANTFTFANYTLAGWKLSSTASSASYAAGEEILTNGLISAANMMGGGETINLYAHWTPVSYQISVVNRVGDSVSNVGGTALITHINGSTVSSEASKNIVYASYNYADKIETVTRFTVTATALTGYSFVGFEVDGEAVSGVTGLSHEFTMYSKATTIYAIFKANTVNITLTATDADNNADSWADNSGYSYSGKSATKTVTYDQTYGTLPTPTRTGYTFKGWFTSTVSNSQITSEDTVKITENTSYFAQWTANRYNISYDANGGEGSVAAESLVAYGTSITTPGISSFRLTGYTLAGFKHNKDGGSADYGLSSAVSVALIASNAGQTAGSASPIDIVLYAHYTANAYNVTFVANGGTFAEESITSFTATYNETYKVSDYIKGISRAGYDFAGFKVGSSSTYIQLNGTIHNLVSENDGAVTLTAEWTIHSYTLAVAASSGGNAYAGASGTNTTASYNYGATFTARAIATSGYHFIGWYSDEGYETQVSTDATFLGNMPALSANGETYNLYARFEIDTYTINLVVKTFINNVETDIVGGTVSSTNYTPNYNETVTLSYTENAGYHYVGYYSNPECTTSITITNGQYTVTAQGSNNAVINIYIRFDANTYTVTFNSNGGELEGAGTGAQTFYYDTEYSVSDFVTSITRDGYVFAGWAYNSNTYQNTDKLKNLTTVNNGSVELVASWTANTFTVVYNSNGANGSVDTETVKFNEEIEISNGTGLSLVGYHFTGWALSNEGEVVPTITGTMTGEELAKAYGLTAPYASATITLYAIFEANKINVIFSATDATENASAWSNMTGFTASGKTASKEFTYDETYGTLPTPVREGYNFKGWFTSTSSTTQITSSTTVKVTSETTYYAQWTVNTYNLTIYVYTKVGNANATESSVGGRVSAPSSVNFGSTATMTATANTGYSFAGFYEGAGVGGTLHSSSNPATTDAMGTSGLVYTALFTANTYTITFASNGGNLVGTTTITAVYSQSYLISSYITSATRAGYDFAGYLGSNGQTYQSTSTLTNLASSQGATVTLTAQWDIHDEYTLVVDAKPDGSGTASITRYNGTSVSAVESASNVTYGTGTTVTASPSAGYHFIAWHEGTVSGTQVSISATYTFNMPALSSKDSTYTLVAEFAKDTYTMKLEAVTFIDGVISSDHVGGTVDPEEDEVTFGDKVTISATPNAGYSFIGWYANANCTIEAEVTLGSYTVPAQGNNGASLTLYAKFEANTYTVTYNKVASGATGTTAQSTHTYDKQSPLTANGFSLTGYHFLGWDTKEAGASVVHADRANVTNLATSGNVNLYAVWEANKYNISYDGVTGTESVTYEDKITTNSGSSLHEDGYTLVGWSLNDYDVGLGSASYELSTEYNVSKIAGDAGKASGNSATQDIVLYPVYTANTYTIKYSSNYPTSPDSKDNTSITGQSLTYTSSEADTTTLYTQVNSGFTYTGSVITSWRIKGTSTTYAVGSAQSILAILTAAGVINNNGAVIELEAIWSANSYNLTLTERYVGATSASELDTIKTGDTGGTVTGDGSYNYGDTVSLTATANTGYSFIGWYSNEACTTLISSSANYQYKMPASETTLYAKFEIQKYTLTINVFTKYGTAEATANTSGGTITGTPSLALSGTAYSVNVYYGQTASLTARVTSSNSINAFTFTGWYVGNTATGTATSTSASLTTTAMTTSGLTYSALFTARSFTLSVYAYTQVGGTAAQESSVGGSVSGAGQVVYNQTASINAVASSGFSFAGWYQGVGVSGESVGASASLTTSAMTTSGLSYTALFTANLYTVTIHDPTAGGFGIIGTSGNTKEQSFYVVTSSLATQSVTVTASPSTGYSFDAWYTNSSYTGKESESATYTFNMPASNVNLYPRFTINSYNVTLNVMTQYGTSTNRSETNGGNVSGGGQVEFGQTTQITATPNSNYTFVAWYKGNTISDSNIYAETATTTTEAMGTSGLVYTALFKANEYTATIYTYTQIGALSPVKASMTLSITSSYSTASRDSSNNRYTISIPYTKSISIASGANTGYTFAGIYSGEGISGNALSTTSPYTTNAQGTSAQVFSVLFTANKFTLTINKGTGVNSITYSTNTLSQATITSETVIDIYVGETINMSASMLSGYHFASWTASTGISANGSTNSSISFTIPASATNYTITANATADTYNVVLIAYTDGVASETGGTVSGAGSVTFGASKTVTASAKDGYHFVGWYTDATLDTSVSDQASYRFTMHALGQNNATYTLYASFERNTYNLALNAYTNGTLSTTGGSVLGAQSGVLDGTSVTARATANNGYHFLGWFTTTDFSGTPVSTSSEYTFKLDHNRVSSHNGTYTLNAAFAVNTYTITVNANGGNEEDIVSGSLNYTSSYTTPANNVFTKTGYSLVGFAHTANGAKAYDCGANVNVSTIATNAGLNGNYASTTNITLYAVWQANEYDFNVVVYTQVGNTTTQSDAGGKVTAPSKITFDSTVSMTASSNSGYTFVGFYRSSTFTQTNLISSSTTASSDTCTSTSGLTQYALFRAVTNTLTIYLSPSIANLGVTLSTNNDNYSFSYSSADYRFTVSLPTSESIVVSANALTDYKFDAWYTGNGVVSDNKVDGATIDNLEITMTAGGLTYTLSYVSKTYNLVYNYEYTIGNGQPVTNTLAGGTLGSKMSSADVTYQLNANAFKDAFDAVGLTLSGWKISKSGSTAIYEAGHSGLTASGLADAAGVRGTDGATINLWAVYTSKSVTVNTSATTNGSTSTTGGKAYITKLNGSSITQTTSTSVAVYTVNTSLNTLTRNNFTVKAEANPGYHFNGWTPSNTLTEVTADVAVSGNTYTANFVVDTYTIAFHVVTFKDATNIETNISNVGGSITAPSQASGQYTYGQVITLQVSASTGYTFGGWYTNSSCTVSATVTDGEYTVPAQSANGATINLYAKFTANQYTITFLAEDATSWNNTTGFTSTTGGYRKTYYYNSTLDSTLPTPSRDGWVFNGWFTSRTGGDQIQGGSVVRVTANTTYYAQFTLNRFSVTITNYSIGLSGSLVADTAGNITEVTGGAAHDYGTDVTITATPATGYSFDGWYKDATCTNAYFTTNNNATTQTFTMPNNNVVIYAKFVINSYNLTIQERYQAASNATTLAALANGDVGGTTTGEGSFKYGESVTVTASAKTGYTFVGWYTNADCTTLATGSGNTSTSYTFNMPANGYTLYARFVISRVQVSVTAKYKDATGASALGSLQTGTTRGTANFATLLSSSTVTSTATANNVTSGYILYGTSVTATASPLTYNSVPYEVNWYSNADCTTSSDATVSGSKTSVYALFTPVRYNLSVTEYYQSATSATQLGSLTLGPTGGSVEGAGTTYHGQSRTLTAVASTGYVFEGWYTNSACTTPWQEENNSNTSLVVTVTGATSVYAKFVQARYTLTLTPMFLSPISATQIASTPVEGTDGGTVSGGGTYYYGQPIAISATAADGYTFDGWFTNSACTTSANVTDSISITSNRTLYAKFTARQYTLSLSAKYQAATSATALGDIKDGNNGGTVSGSGNYYFGQTVTLTASPATGYIFDGWYNSSNKRVSQDASYNYTTTKANVSLYALFVQSQYTLTVVARYQAATSATALGSLQTGNDGGTVANGGLTYYGQSRTVSYTQTEEQAAAYVFDGWYSNEACTNALSSATITVTSNTTVYAKFVQRQYTLTLTPRHISAANATTLASITNGTTGGTVSGGGTYYYGQSRTITASAETGYSFNGWFETENCTGTAVSTNASYSRQITKSETLYAKFTVNSYNLSLEVRTRETNNGTISSSANGNTAVISAVIGGTSVASGNIYYNQAATLVTQAATGYVFSGWFTDSNCESEATVTSGRYTVTGARTLYALFTRASYTIEAISRFQNSASINTLGSLTTGVTGGYVGSSSSSTYTVSAYHGASVNLTATAGTGYTFKGWYSDSGCQTRISTNTTYTISSVTGSATVYAKFVKTAYTVSVVARFVGATNATTLADISTGTTGGTVSIAPAIYDDNDTTFNRIRGYFTGYDVTVSYDAATGYTFNGWFTNEACTQSASVTDDGTYTVAGNATLYAKFTINSYTLTLTARYQSATSAEGLGDLTTGPNGGKVSGGGATYYGQSRTISATAKGGYTFVGWYTNIECTSGENTSATRSVTVTANTTLYAKFVQTQYTLTATARYQNSASINTLGSLTTGKTGGRIAGAGSIYHGQGRELTATAASGYTFIGWFSNEACTTAITTTGIYTVNNNVLNVDGVSGNVTVYAKFVRTAYALSVEAMFIGAENATTKADIASGTTGGTASISTSAYSGNGMTGYFAGYNVTLTASAATGYTFTGWYSSADCSGTALSTATTYSTYSKTATSQTVYALFTINEYTLSVTTRYQAAATATTYESLSPTATGGGTVSGGGTVLHGQSRTVTATANTGYSFVGWFTSSDCSGTAVSTSASYSRTVTSSHTLYAKFVQSRCQVTITNRYQSPASATTLNTITNGTVGGATNMASVLTSATNGNTATSSNQTSGYILYGKAPTFNNNASANYTFVGLFTNADCTTSYTATNAITATTTIYAKYAPKTYTVNIVVYTRTATGATSAGTPAQNTNGGTVSPTTRNLYIYDTNILSLFTTSPKTGYQFDGFYTANTFASSAKVTEYQGTATDTTYTLYALFTQPSVSLNLVAVHKTATNATTIPASYATGTDGGTVSGGGTIYYGQTREIVASPEDNYIFVGWYTGANSGSLVSGSATYDYTMASTSTVTLYARFETATYQVSVAPYYRTATSATTVGSVQSGTTGGTVSGSGTYYVGFSVTVTASPTTGYTLTGWYSNTACTTSASNTINGEAGETYYRYALFTTSTYTVTLSATDASNNSSSWSNKTGWTTSSSSKTASITLYRYSSGTISLPTPSRNGYTFAGWYTATSGGTKVTNAIYTSYTNRTLYAQWYANRTINVTGISRTPASMHGSTITTQSLAAANTSATGNASTSTTVTRISVTGYTFVGWYRSTTINSSNLLSTETSYTVSATGTTTLYAYYTPNSTTITVRTYYLNSSSTYSLSNTGGSIDITCGSTTVSLSGSNGTYTFTAYYGGSYKITADPNTYYEAYGFNTNSSSTPTSVSTTGATYTFTPYSSTTVNNIQVLFRGKNITVTYNANGASGVTMPSSVTQRYGTRVTTTLGFNAFAREYYQNLGFNKKSSASSATIARSKTSSSATVSYVLNSTNVTISGTNGTLYAIWSQPKVWVTPLNSSGGTLALDSFDRGYSTVNAAFTAISGNSSVARSTVTVVTTSATLSSAVTISKPVTITARSASNRITVSGSASFVVNALTTVNGVTIAGSTTATNGLFNVGTTTLTVTSATISGLTAKNIFFSDNSTGVINVTSTSITGCTTGASGTYGSIVNLTTGATATLTGVTVTGHEAVGVTMFNINASTLNVNGCTIGSSTSANTYTGSSFEAVFYNTNGTLNIGANGSTDTTIICGDVRAVYTTGDGAETEVDAEIS